MRVYIYIYTYMYIDIYCKTTFLILDKSLKDTDYKHSTFPKYYNHLAWLSSAFLIHFAPFWFMTRILYPHHYLPAFIFSAMFIGESALRKTLH